MPEPKRSNNVGLKIIACCAAGAVLCLGLCQAGLYLERNVHDGGPSGLDTIGGIGLVLSAIGVFVGVIFAILESIASGTSPRKR